MSTTGWIILIVVVVVILAVIALLASRQASKRRMQQRAEQADRLRYEAGSRQSDIADSHHQVTRAEAEAAEARRQAEEAEIKAREARQGFAQDQARQEDLVREADRLDPHVDDSAENYRPTLGGQADAAPADGSHADRP